MKRAKKKIINSISKLVILMIVLALIFTVMSQNSKKEQEQIALSIEQIKSQSYKQVGENENGTETEYVKFDAFFLEDTNGDGYAEEIRGTCNRIGESDTLYMELNVLQDGKLENGKITINSSNFYFQTAIVKDVQISKNYISSNTREIALNEVQNGTQKMIRGTVRSGDYSSVYTENSAIGNDKSKYSKENTITLTGTHVAENGTRTQINKTVKFQVDWYGETRATINQRTLTKELPKLSTLTDGEHLNLEFTISTGETLNELILKKAYLEGTIPDLNGYEPENVIITGADIEYDYSKEDHTFKVWREAKLAEDVVTQKANVGTSYTTRTNSYTIKIIYPIESYGVTKNEETGEIEERTTPIEIAIPLKAHYDGYNNPDEKLFKNPYTSNIAETTLFARWIVESPEPEPEPNYANDFSVTIGRYIGSPYYEYMISKEKPLRIYNGISQSETDDTYIVSWKAYVGTNKDGEGNKKPTKVTMSEAKEENKADEFLNEQQSMENIVSNKGIYFSGAGSLLKEDGWIDVINADTNEVIHRFTKEDWNEYSSTEPYYYQENIKHIKIETSEANIESSMYVYHIKEIDDTYLTENYDIERFNQFIRIRTQLYGKIEFEDNSSVDETTTHSAEYEAPLSRASINIKQGEMSTQETLENEVITIQTHTSMYNEQDWKNGAFIVKLPSEIIDVKINNVDISNKSVNLTGYDIYEKDGTYYIKILTENEEPASYNITINCNLTANPTVAVGKDPNKSIELYATNEDAVRYHTSKADTYDVNGNLNYSESVNYSSTILVMRAPEVLITHQITKHYDNTDNITIAPQVAKVEKTQRTAEIDVTVANNYTETISEIVVLGKIPFQGNKHIVNSHGDLGSEFTTTFVKTEGQEPITIPDQLKKYVKIYYSTQKEPTTDLTDENEWKTSDQITTEEWKNIKTYRIDLQSYEMENGETYTFTYNIALPEGVDYNKKTYSVHAVYFCLNTEDGKYRTQTEPSKLGFMIAKQYDLEIAKFQKNSSNVIGGITYRIQEKDQEESKIRVTDENGKIKIEGLYAERTYIIKELRTTSDYEINEEEIEFTTKVENDQLKVEVLNQNSTKSATATKEDGQDWLVKIELEDKVKAKLQITKKNVNGDVLKNVKFRLTGKGKSGTILTTNEQGIVLTKGLYLDQQYKLEEVKATGYYLMDGAITFEITNASEGEGFELKLTDSNDKCKSQKIEVENGLPTINFEIEDEKIPTYDLEILKVEKDKNEGLPKAQFKLEGEGITGSKYYTTDDTGKIELKELYQYDSSKKLSCEYTLTEVLAPEGYVLDNTPVKFKAEKQSDETLKLTILEPKPDFAQIVESEGTLQIKLENDPIFKLTKINGEKLLPNAKFKIYLLDDEGKEIREPAKDSKGNIIGDLVQEEGEEDQYIITTDEKGEISLDLPQGLYKLVEVEAPEGYELSNKEYFIGIGESRPEERTFDVGWANGVEGKNWNKVNSSYKTSDGGLVIVGAFHGQSTIDNKTIESEGDYDAFIAKYSSDGTIENVKTFGGALDEEFTKVVQTSDGEYAVVGYTESANLGEQELKISGSTDGILLKLDSELGYKWSKVIGGVHKDRLNSIIEDRNNNLVIVGSYSDDTLKIDNETELSSETGGNRNGFIASFSSDGQTENWCKTMKGENRIEAVDLTETSEGYAVAVNYMGDMTIEGNSGVTISAKGTDYQDGLVIGYNSSGEYEWNYKFSSSSNSSNEKLTSIITTSDDSIVVSGSYAGNIALQEDEQEVATNGSYDSALIKLSAGGGYQAHIAFGGSDDDVISQVVETQDGGLLIGGWTYSSDMDINGDKQNDITDGDTSYGNAYISKLTSDFEEIVFADKISGTSSYEATNTVLEYGQESHERYIAAGWYDTTSLNALNKQRLTRNGTYADGFVISYENVITKAEIPSLQQIEVPNNLKKYKITTEIAPVKTGTQDVINKRTGGTVNGDSSDHESDQFRKLIEQVEHGKDGENEIIIKPNDKFKIVKVTINGEEQEIKINEKGEYVIEKFKEVTEDKHIVIEFANQMSSIKVHHYLVGTGEEFDNEEEILSPDQYQAGQIGKDYTTSPNTDLADYEIATNADYYGAFLTEAERTEEKIMEKAREKLQCESDDKVLEKTGYKTVAEFLESYYIPQNSIGTFKETEQEITYYYKVRTYKVTVHHYIEGTDTHVPNSKGKEVPDIVHEKKYKKGEEYSTDPADNQADPKTQNEEDDIDYSMYELVDEPANKDGKIEGDTEVTYFYRLKDSSGVIVHHNLVGTGEEYNTTVETLAPDDKLPDAKVGTEYYARGTQEGGDTEYTTGTSAQVPANYRVATYRDYYRAFLELEQETEEINDEKIITKAIEKLREAKGDNKLTQVELLKEFGCSTSEEFLNKEYVPSNAGGKYKDVLTEVTYYYILKDAVLGNTITKDGTETLHKEKDFVTYTINYTATINEYIGNAIVTLTDTLPYQVDETQLNDFAGGEYDSSTKTITWKELIKDIDTFKEEQQKKINISKTIKVVFKDIDYSKTSMENNVNGNVQLPTTGQKSEEVTDNAVTNFAFLKNIKVDKVWADEDDKYTKRPESIRIVVRDASKDSTENTVATYDLKLSEGTSHTFEKLPKYNEQGKEINYIVSEEEVTDGDLKFYESTVQSPENNEIDQDTEDDESEPIKTYLYTITNTFTVPDDKITVSAEKVWNDENDQYGRRPTSLVIVLKNAGGDIVDEQPITVDEHGSWKYTSKEVPKYNSTTGEEITYSVEEKEAQTDDLKFYTQGAVTGNQTDGFQIENTFTVPDDTIELVAKKVWDDTQDFENKRPQSITLKVVDETQQEVASYVVDSSNNWTHTFTELPKYNKTTGAEIQYTIVEEEKTDGDLRFYKQKETQGSITEGFNITNKLVLENSNVVKTGTETILSKDDVIEYHLNYSATLDEYDDTATVTIIDTLPYEIDETKEKDLADGVYNSADKTITWTYNTKDNPEIFTMDGTKKLISINKTIRLVYKDIAKLESGTKIHNVVKGIIKLANDATEERQASCDTVANFKVSVKVQKLWEGDALDENPEKRPAVVVQLLSDGEKIEEFILNNANNWQHVWNELKRYNTSTGEEINYTVTEDVSPTGYYITNSTSEVTQQENGIPLKSFTITNAKLGSIEITKVDKTNSNIKLSGAEFKLEKLKQDERSHWIIDDSFETRNLTTQEDGIITFKDLEYGKYRITEVTAPNNYNLLGESIEIDINAESPDYKATISNKAKTVLPNSGGNGIFTFVICGLITIFIATRVKGVRKNKGKHN